MSSNVSGPPYLTYSRYLRQRHGCAVHRIAVDAGFSCPNRKGGRAAPGCSYCDADGARAPYVSGTLERQVREGISFYQRTHGDGEYILYFQAYSNTNAPVGELRAIYDAGLALADFRGLNVATRPDCLDEAKADLIASYGERGLEVWVELGLQSANDETLRHVGRGHTAADFERAFQMLRARKVKVAAHLIFGLPGEGREEILATMRFLARIRPDGVKIHNLHIPRGTALAREYQGGELTVPSPRRHLEYVIAAIEHLPPETVIMRLTCDTPVERLAAPRNFWPKEKFLSTLDREMRARGCRQGRLFETSEGRSALTGRGASFTFSAEEDR